MADEAEDEHVVEQEKTCNDSVSKDDYSSRLAVEADGHKIDIVAVHDIGGHQRTTWTKDDDTGSCWLPEVYPESRIMLYGYDTSGRTSNIYTRHGIYSEANRLLTSLRARREGLVHNREKRSIAFVCHGLGGLIVKAALILASRSAPMFEDIIFATRALVFIDYPTRQGPGSKQLTQEWLTRVFQPKTALMTEYQSELLSSLCESLHEIGTLFIHSPTRNHALIFDLPHKVDSSVRVSQEWCRRILRFSMVSEAHIVCERPFAHDHLYSRVGSQTSQSDSSTPALPLTPYASLEALKAAWRENWLYGDIKEHHVETLKQLSSQVSPFLPSVHPRSPDPIPILDNLLATHKGSIVHIRSDAYADRSAGLAEVYLETHSSNSVEMVRFNFNSHDIRYNNITAMLRTWLCQVSFHNMKFKLWPTSRVLEYMRALQAWTEKDLFLFWFRFIMDESDSDTIYIIGGLDQCDSSVEQFLSSLGRLFTETEHPLRIIVTTTKEHDVGMRDKLHATMPPEVYQELQVDTNNLLVEDQEDLSVRLDVLLQRNPRYLRAGLGQRIAEIIDSSQLDGDLKHVVTTWLACNHIPLDSIESHVASLTPPTPELVFECILSGMPTERQGWARQLLFLVLQSVRAIRAEEFWIFSQTVFNEISCGKVESALSWFGGLLRIQYDEVQVGHPRLRNWLDAGHVRLNTRAWWRYDSKSQGHFDILETCLNILRHPGKHIYQPIPPGFHSLPYAVQFWHMHYQEVHKEVGALATSASQSALDFFADSTAFQKWIQAYISITDPFTAPDPTSTRPLPMASHLGLRDLVTALEIEYPEDLTDALIEAARKGHLEIVRHLAPLSPKQFRLQDPKLEKLLKAATSSGKNEVVGEILDLIPRHNPDSEEGPAWISELLPQACWLGNDQLVGILLDLGADPRTPMQYSNGEIRPLDLSIQTRKINVTKLLLERDAALCLDHSQLPRMLGVWADLEIMELLLANGYKVEAEADGFTALETACINGRPMIADFLLTQRPSLIDNIDTRKGAAIVCSDNENVKTLRVMLKHGVDVNAVPSDAPDGNALRGAISNDRLDICQLLVQHKIEVNDVSGGITPPVVRAVSCTEQSVAILRLLLDNGADPEKKEPVGEGVWGRTALLVASALDTEDAPEMIKVLLEHHADTSARDSDGWTPSYTAANFGRVNNLRLLIDAGADLYAACGPLKWNSLQGAFHDAEVVRLLLDNHMDPFEKYEADCSVLELSARNNKPSCVEGMLKRSGERKESAIAEALQAAVSWASPETVRLLLDAGADVDRTSDKRTLLSRALEEGNEDIIRMILEFRPHLDHPDLDDKTLLHFIGSDTTFSSLKLLVNAGARIDGVDNDGRSPLTSAVEDGNMVAMRYLLMKPAARLAINICGPWGAPLHVACWRPSFEMVTALIENGADANLSYEGEVVRRTPIAQACVARGDNYDPEKKRVVEYLLEDAGAVATGTEDTTSPIHLGTLACSGDLVKLLIRHGANPAHRDEIGRKPIHLACYNSLEALEALNASDEDFAAKDKLGRVPLHFAVLSSQLELLKYVLERSKKAGLDIDVRDNDGWTPLLWAARGTDLYIWDREQREIRAKEVIGFLLDNAADPAARGYVRRHFGEMEIHEWSASDVAAYHGLSELTEILAGADPSASRNANVKAGQTIGNEPKNIYCDGCYVSKEDVHPKHDFELFQPKFPPPASVEGKPQPNATEAVISTQDKMKELGLEDSLDDEVVSNDEDE